LRALRVRDAPGTVLSKLNPDRSGLDPAVCRNRHFWSGQMPGSSPGMTMSGRNGVPALTKNGRPALFPLAEFFNFGLWIVII
jgi:hypothetical protein